jgi:D-lactate dehydrogenase (cytochrome)
LPQLAAFLKSRLGVELCLDPDIVVGFSSDSSNLPGKARGLFRPASERECAAILRACHQAGLPLTLSGGRTNLTGSATPPDGVVLSTVKMMQPEVQVEAASRTVICPVGLLLEDLRRQVLAQSGGSLMFSIDPTSRAEASIGGALACNASGFTPGETGAIRSRAAAVRFLLPDGWAVAARRGEYISRSGEFILDRAGALQPWPLPRYPRPAIKNAGGPYSAPDGIMDFIDLVVGSEGIFGLVTAATLTLAEKPAEYLDLFISMPREADAIRFLEATRARLGGDFSVVSAFEYFGAHCRRYMLHEERFFHGADQVAVYVQEPLLGRTLEDRVEFWVGLLEQARCPAAADKILMLDSDAQRALFLEARHSMPARAVEIVQQRGAYTIMTDTVVPPDRFPAFLEFTHGLLGREGLDYLSFGHLGDCHLHFTIVPERAQLERAAACYDAIVARSAELGGVYSGEHGTGKRKRRDFLSCYGPAAVAQVRRAKAAVDPRFLLNQGNVVEPPAG